MHGRSPFLIEEIAESIDMGATVSRRPACSASLGLEYTGTPKESQKITISAFPRPALSADAVARLAQSANMKVIRAAEVLGLAT
jgi:hypothetical protein